MSVRDRVADVLRNLAPIPAERVWGRARNILVHDSSSEGYLDEEDKSHGVGRETAFDPHSLGAGGNVWAGSPESVAEALDKAGLLAAEGRFVGYAVISETRMGENGQVAMSASTVRDDRPAIERGLVYAREVYGDTDTRYFIAEVREVCDAVE